MSSGCAYGSFGFDFAFDETPTTAGRFVRLRKHLPPFAPTLTRINRPRAIVTRAAPGFGATLAVSLELNDRSSATKTNAADDPGIYADYGNHDGAVQLASMTIPMGSIGKIGANPANWANLKRLADGSLELGSGQIIAAATLLSAIDRSRERDAVRSAIAKFGLNPTQAAAIWRPSSG